jgi:hypothetical protein
VILAAFPSELWREYVQEPGRQGIFLVLAAFLGSFLFIRTSARLSRSDRDSWWPGSVVTDSGVHLHHLVWGIVSMMVGGSLGFATNGQEPWFELSAILFGIGVGLTFDEFALWVYLRDVYWASEGRTSIDAVAIVAAFMGLVFLGVNPLKVTGDDVLATLVSLGYTLGALVVTGICFAKSRFLHGFAALIFPPIGLWGLVRLGKPRSPWARWRYGDRDPQRQRRAEERFRPDRRVDQIIERVRVLVGGIPTAPPACPPKQLRSPEHDASLEAALEIQARAMAEAQAAARQRERTPRG